MAEPGFTLVQLRYFTTAARLGSMTAAAAELVVSQSAISTAVAQLERQLGVQLLLRHHAKGLTLTEAGQGVFVEALRLLDHSAELAELAREAGSELRGSLSVGCFTTLGPFELPGIVSEYQRLHPLVRINVIEAEHAALKHKLRGAECELALLYGYELDDDLDIKTVALAAPYVIVSPTHRLAQRGSVHLAELADDPMVLLDLPHSAGYLRSVVESVGVRPDVRHRSSGFETVRAMVAHGHGYAVLNQRPNHSLTYDGAPVVALDIADEVPPLAVVVAWLKGVRLTRRARAFVAVAHRLHRDQQPRLSEYPMT
ncbi:MAG: LysR family transcriptional regulator [Nocardioides sp.]